MVAGRDVARELRRCRADQDRELPDSVEPFVDRYEAGDSSVTV